MFVQLLVLSSVAAYYVFDHFKYYRKEVSGRWEENPAGNHGHLPFGPSLSLFWLCVEVTISMYAIRS